MLYSVRVTAMASCSASLVVRVEADSPKEACQEAIEEAAASCERWSIDDHEIDEDTIEVDPDECEPLDTELSV